MGERRGLGNADRPPTAAWLYVWSVTEGSGGQVVQLGFGPHGAGPIRVGITMRVVSALLISRQGDSGQDANDGHEQPERREDSHGPTVRRLRRAEAVRAVIAWHQQYRQ